LTFYIKINGVPKLAAVAPQATAPQAAIVLATDLSKIILD
jgi:hypothetical protein